MPRINTQGGCMDAIKMAIKSVENSNLTPGLSAVRRIEDISIDKETDLESVVMRPEAHTSPRRTVAAAAIGKAKCHLSN